MHRAIRSRVISGSLLFRNDAFSYILFDEVIFVTTDVRFGTAGFRCLSIERLSYVVQWMAVCAKNLGDGGILNWIYLITMAGIIELFLFMAI